MLLVKYQHYYRNNTEQSKKYDQRELYSALKFETDERYQKKKKGQKTQIATAEQFHFYFSFLFGIIYGNTVRANCQENSKIRLYRLSYS